MDKDKSENFVDDNVSRKPASIHFILANAYIVFFVAVILGVLIDFFINPDIFLKLNYPRFGFSLIIIGTILIYWAQNSSAKASKISMEESNAKGFAIGPYKYFRHPTYLGLFIASLGLGLILHSIIAIILVTIAYILIRFVFAKKEENFLLNKYGDKYTEYKNRRKKKA